MRYGLTILAITVLALTGCASPENGIEGPAVAVVADTPIALEEYRRSYVDYLVNTGLPDEPVRREAFLRRMINVRLIAEEARAEGIERTDEFQHRKRLVSSKLLVNALLQHDAYSDIRVTEDDLQDMFVRANTQITARHLYARTEAGARSLKARLDAGATFAELAEEVFKDPQLASNGGLIGPFGFDEMDPAFEEAAFHLPVGEISNPVQTATGYSIIKVEDRTAKPILTETEFAERRDRLEDYVAYRKKSKARADYLAGVMADLEPLYERAALEALAEVVLGGTITGGSAIDGILPAESLDDDAVLVRFNGTTDDHWTIADFRAAAAVASPEQRSAISTVADLSTFIDGLLAREEMIARARRLDLDRTSRYRMALRHEMDTWVYEQAYGDIVRAIPVADDSLQLYYDTYGSELTTDPLVRVREIVVASEEVRDQVAGVLGRASFADVARRHSIRTGPAGTRGEVMEATREQLGLLADPVFESTAGDVIGPVEIGGRHVWIQLVEHVPARPLTFEEARPRIERMVRYSRRQDVLRSRTVELRERFKVEMWPERALDLTLTNQVS